MPQDILYKYFPITKSDSSTRMVTGPMSGANNIDLDGQIVDLAWLRREVGPWFKEWGNIRAQHDPKQPIGVAKMLDMDHPSGVPHVTIKVVDDKAWNNVEEEVYKGMSVGIKGAKIVKDGTCPNGRVVGGKLVELSLVDHPANPSAKFTIVKSAGNDEWSGYAMDVSFTWDEAEAAKGTAGFAEDERDLLTKGGDPDDDEDDDDEEDATKAAMSEMGGQQTHSHSHRHGTLRHIHPHTHATPDMFKNTGPDITHSDHKHCTDCGRDNRVCGHGAATDTKQADATPDVTKGDASFDHQYRNPLIKPNQHAPGYGVEQKGKMDHMNNETGGHPTNQQAMVQRAVKARLTAMMQELDNDIAQTLGGEDRHYNPNATAGGNEFVRDGRRVAGDKWDPGYVGERDQQWNGVDSWNAPTKPGAPATPAHHQSFDASQLKGVDTDVIKAIALDAVYTVLRPLFPNSDGILTKGGTLTPDSLKAAFVDQIEAVATKAAEAVAGSAISTVAGRLSKVEEMAAPPKGPLSNIAIEKRFALNPTQRAVVEDEINKSVGDMSEEQRTKNAARWWAESRSSR